MQGLNNLLSPCFVVYRFINGTVMDSFSLPLRPISKCTPLLALFIGDALSSVELEKAPLPTLSPVFLKMPVSLTTIESKCLS
jgi:hypothetical protein